MGVTRIVDLINTFSAQCCMSVGKSGHERVKLPQKWIYLRVKYSKHWLNYC